MTRLARRPQAQAPQDGLLPIPKRLPPIEGLANGSGRATGRRRTWLQTLLAALAVTVLVLAVLILGGLGVYQGLKDRAAANHQAALDHYALGMKHLEAGEYELALAEFEVAMRSEPGLPDLQSRLQEADALVKAQTTPTSEARQGAVITLYKQAVADYGGGNLEQVVAALDELRGLDLHYQRKNVEIMLTTAHYQLGLNAVQEDRLDEASDHFGAVVELKADPTTVKNAQEQLNLLGLYKAALSHWGQDWSATIQALKGLYALAPDYKDVRTRLHDAYALHGQVYAQKGDWCDAADEYTAAVSVFPLEETVDRRDSAAIQCEGARSVPTSTPAAQAKPTARPPAAAGTPTQPVSAVSAAKGRIVFPRYDALLKKQDLFILDLAQRTTQLLRENATQPGFSPGLDKLAFHNLDPSHLGLTVLDLRSGQLQEVTAHFEDSTPTWSRDANQVVFGSSKESDRVSRIYVISPYATRGEGQLWSYGEMPAWAPDGSKIAYRGWSAIFDNYALWLMDPGGFNSTRLTTDPSDTSASWKPDGSQIAFISSRAGNWELYAVDVATGKERRLTNHPAADVAPVWSPDGKRLAFLSNREGGWAIYLLDVKTGKVQKLIDTGDPYPDAVSERLAWLP